LTTPIEDLQILTSPGINSWADANMEVTRGARAQTRPLGTLSDFVCEKIGTYNDLAREGIVPPREFRDAVNEAVEQVSLADTENDLARAPVSTRRIAILDLAWIERSLNIAFVNSEEYRESRDGSPLFKLTKRLATAEGRHPLLSWSDIAIYHPLNDPRSFLTNGDDRDQEILMYRIQSSMERVHKDMIDTAQDGLDGIDAKAWMLRTIEGLELVVAAMIHLSRVRRVGQFYKLDPFLSEHGVPERGHGTGAFSVWTFLAGVFLSRNHNHELRLRDPENQMAFDRDGDEYVRQVIAGRFKCLDELVADYKAGPAARHELEGLCEVAQKKLARFGQTHRGAMRKHSALSFDVPAPSMPDLSNKRAIDAAIADSLPPSDRPLAGRDDQDDAGEADVGYSAG
jgi:hypothetical protein